MQTVFQLKSSKPRGCLAGKRRLRKESRSQCHQTGRTEMTTGSGLASPYGNPGSGRLCMLTSCTDYTLHQGNHTACTRGVWLLSLFMMFAKTNQISHIVVHGSNVHVCTCVSHCSTIFHYIKMPRFTYFRVRTFPSGNPRVCHFYLDESVGYLGAQCS